jgi:hypothetical protein
MSHVIVRMLADRFADTNEGIDAVAATVPRFDGDEIPPEVTVYDETRTGWVARRKAPREGDADPEIEYPCVVVYLQSASMSAGVPELESTGARVVTGTATVVAQLLMDDVDTEQAIKSGQYLLRAMRGVVHRFDDPSNQDDRTACYTEVGAADSIQQSNVTAFVEDSICSPGALLLSYPFKETVPLT